MAAEPCGSFGGSGALDADRPDSLIRWKTSFPQGL